VWAREVQAFPPHPQRIRHDLVQRYCNSLSECSINTVFNVHGLKYYVQMVRNMYKNNTYGSKYYVQNYFKVLQFKMYLKGSDMTWFKGLKDDLIDSSPKYRYDQSNHTGRSLYSERRVHYRIAISRYCNSKCTWFKILCTNGSKYYVQNYFKVLQFKMYL
jgi:hypothetical protein